MTDSGISFRAVSHTYRPPRGQPVLALDRVSLDVREREFLALLGPSGCGKSTLLYLLGGFLPVESGSISVAGRPVAGPGPDRGIVFQNFALYPWKDRKSTRLNSSHQIISYAVFCLKKKNNKYVSIILSPTNTVYS